MFLVFSVTLCLLRPQVTFNKMNLIYTAETKFMGFYMTGTLTFWHQSFTIKF